jgi:hypothetical protein
MKPNPLLLIFLLILIVSISKAEQRSPNSPLKVERDSVIVMQQVGMTPATIALTTLKVSGQTVCGILGGIVGMSVVQFNPAAAGIGAIIGSSACVYWIGSIGNDRGQYKWVLLAGGINGALYTPVFLNNQHSGFGAIGIVGLAMVTTITSEIITFYATQKDIEPNVNVGMILLPSHKRGSFIPGVNLSIRL